MLLDYHQCRAINEIERIILMGDCLKRMGVALRCVGSLFSFLSLTSHIDDAQLLTVSVNSFRQLYVGIVTNRHR